ncbi:Hypothetical protein, predicted lipoprotein [Mycoplasmopsis bovigenitalium 51080]|uniref:Lipoprotein n=1 Tax=Mycoplasmopsis bovigenitalium 51080 TaxID=1188235 RepID=N9VC21_9BACT|nr:hypothetical protein [Mycoplasmopsis bovigenitalium]ENY69203.1 Hypothetical protein, predicted lipoprotein [Mycoplasmopsis bovigenitalium 51080]
MRRKLLITGIALISPIIAISCNKNEPQYEKDEVLNRQLIDGYISLPTNTAWFSPENKKLLYEFSNVMDEFKIAEDSLSSNQTGHFQEDKLGLIKETHKNVSSMIRKHTYDFKDLIEPKNEEFNINQEKFTEYLQYLISTYKEYIQIIKNNAVFLTKHSFEKELPSNVKKMQSLDIIAPVNQEYKELKAKKRDLSKEYYFSLEILNILKAYDNSQQSFNNWKDTYNSFLNVKKLNYKFGSTLLSSRAPIYIGENPNPDTFKVDNVELYQNENTYLQFDMEEFNKDFNYFIYTTKSDDGNAQNIIIAKVPKFIRYGSFEYRDWFILKNSGIKNKKILNLNKFFKDVNNQFWMINSYDLQNKYHKVNTFESVYQVVFDRFKSNDVKGFFFDIDNIQIKHLDKELIEWYRDFPKREYYPARAVDEDK